MFREIVDPGVSPVGALQYSRFVSVRRARTFLPPAVRAARSVLRRDGYLCMPLAAVGVPLAAVVTATRTLINPRVVSPTASKTARKRFVTASNEHVTMDVHSEIVVAFTDGELLAGKQRETFSGAEAECVQVAVARFSPRTWQRLVENDYEKANHPSSSTEPLVWLFDAAMRMALMT